MRKIFRDQKSNHEIHENIVPQIFGAIRYARSVNSITHKESKEEWLTLLSQLRTMWMVTEKLLRALFDHYTKP